MVRFGHSAFDQFFAHAQRERYVYEVVAVDVANFTVTDAVLCAAKTMWRIFDFFPACNLGMDLLPSALHRHGSLAPKQPCPQAVPLDARQSDQATCEFSRGRALPDRYFVFRNRRISRITRSL